MKGKTFFFGLVKIVRKKIQKKGEMVMQYVIKGMMISISNIVIGGFLGMLMHIGNVQMQAGSSTGFIMFLGTIIASLVYLWIEKKFVLGKDLTVIFPALGMILGLWIGWTYNVWV